MNENKIYYIIEFKCIASWIKEKNIIVESLNKPTIDEAKEIIKKETFDSVDFEIIRIDRISIRQINDKFGKKNFPFYRL